MPTVIFSPDHLHAYQASIEPMLGDGRAVMFGFGHPGSMIAVSIAADGEPDSFGRFCARWNSAAIAGDAIDLWAGFMAPRYVLGYFSQWELLPAALRLQAARPTAATVTPPVVIAAIRRWDAGWERQLQPLCHAMRPPIEGAQP